MKKITLLLIICFALSFNGHAQLFSEDFSGGWQGVWVQFDVDGDGQGFSSFSGHMSSFSFQNPTQYFPNNYVVSPAIDVTGSTSLSLAYQAGSQFLGFSAELFTVYVSTGNTVADLNNPAITVSETVDLDLIPAADAALVSFNLDASALDGATTVYIGFRHFYDDSTMEVLNIDDVVLTGTTLGLDDNVFAGFKHFVDARNILQLSSTNKNIEGVAIYNLLGQNVLSHKLSSTDASIDLSKLNSGIYIAKVSIDGASNSFKILKK